MNYVIFFSWIVEWVKLTHHNYYIILVSISIHSCYIHKIVKTYVIHLSRTYVTILCNWLIIWQNAFYLKLMWLIELCNFFSWIVEWVKLTHHNYYIILVSISIHSCYIYKIVRTYVIHLLGTYVTILCNWLILWQNAFYLYLGRSRMCLILQETLF